MVGGVITKMMATCPLSLHLKDSSPPTKMGNVTCFTLDGALNPSINSNWTLFSSPSQASTDWQICKREAHIAVGVVTTDFSNHQSKRLLSFHLKAAHYSCSKVLMTAVYILMTEIRCIRPAVYPVPMFDVVWTEVRFWSTFCHQTVTAPDTCPAWWGLVCKIDKQAQWALRWFRNRALGAKVNKKSSLPT